MASVQTSVNAMPKMIKISSRSLKRRNVRTAVVLNIITLCNRITILIQLNNLELAKTLLERADELCKLIDDTGMNDRLSFWSAMIKAAEGNVDGACTELLRCIGILGQMPHESQTWATYISKHWNTAIEIMTRNSDGDSETSELILQQLVDRYQETIREEGNMPRTANTTARTLYSLLQSDDGANQSLVASYRGISTTSTYQTAPEALYLNANHSIHDQNAANTNVHDGVNAQTPQQNRSPEELRTRLPNQDGSIHNGGIADVSPVAIGRHSSIDEREGTAPRPDAMTLAQSSRQNEMAESSIAPSRDSLTQNQVPPIRSIATQVPPGSVLLKSGATAVSIINAESGVDNNTGLDRVGAVLSQTPLPVAERPVAEIPAIEHDVNDDHSVLQNVVTGDEPATVSIVRHADQLAFDPTLKPGALEALLNMRKVSVEAPRGSSTESVYGSSDHQVIEPANPIEHTDHTESSAGLSIRDPPPAVDGLADRPSTLISVCPAESEILRTEASIRVEGSTTQPENAAPITIAGQETQYHSVPDGMYVDTNAGSSVQSVAANDTTQQVMADLDEVSSDQPITTTDSQHSDGKPEATDKSGLSDESNEVEPVWPDTSQEQVSPLSQDHDPVHSSTISEESFHTQCDSNSTTASSSPVDNDALIDELLNQLTAEQEGIINQSRSGSKQSNSSVRSRTGSRTSLAARPMTLSRGSLRRPLQTYPRTRSRATSRTLSGSNRGNRRRTSKALSTDDPLTSSDPISDLYRSLLANTNVPVQSQFTPQIDSPPLRSRQEIYDELSPNDAIGNLMRGLTSMNRSPRPRTADRSTIRSVQRPNRTIKSPPRQQIASTPGTRRANSILRERLTDKNLIATIQRPAYYSNPVLTPSPLSIPPALTHAPPSPISPISPLGISATLPLPLRPNSTLMSPILDPQLPSTEDNFTDIANAAETIRQLSRRGPSLSLSSLNPGTNDYVNSDSDSLGYSDGHENIKSTYQASTRRGSLELTLPTSPLRTHVEAEEVDNNSDDQDVINGRDIDRKYGSENEGAESGKEDEAEYLDKVRKRTQSLS